MTLGNLTRNLRVLWRADAIIAQIQLHAMLNRFGLLALAALIAAFGLLSLELAAYFALVQVWDAIAAAVALGAANFVIAGIIILIASRNKPGKDMDVALELHKAALAALQADASVIQTEITAIKNIFVRPMDAALAGLIVPAAGLLIKALKKSKAG